MPVMEKKEAFYIFEEHYFSDISKLEDTIWQEEQRCLEFAIHF